jgi:hypothetical protein
MINHLKIAGHKNLLAEYQAGEKVNLKNFFEPVDDEIFHDTDKDKNNNELNH